MNKHILGGVAIVAVAIGGVYAYYHYSKVYPSTDNAYVNANLINMAPKVGGYIHKVYVENNQLVHQGDLLLDINPIDYKLQLTKSQQDMELASQQAKNIQQQITAAKANQTKAMADYKFAAQMAHARIFLVQYKPTIKLTPTLKLIS